MLFDHLLHDAVRVTALLAIALTATALLSAWRSSSASRRMLLALTLGGALALPLVSAAAPAWRVEAPYPLAGLQSSTVTEKAIPATALAPRPEASGEARSSTGRWVVGRPAALDPTDLVAAVWAAGALLLLARLLVGLARTGQIVRRSTPAPEWSRAAAMAEATTGLEVDVRTTTELGAPAVAGVVKPVILVPDTSASWPDARRYVVLLHELAHVRQKDLPSQLVAQLACAAHWYNPLVWLAARRLRVERELAADDAVVAAGARASTYASDLLSIAHGLGAGTFRAPHGALGMAEPSLLATRVNAIVAADRSRLPPTAVRAALITAAVAASVVAIACATPVAATVTSGVVAAPMAPPPASSALDPRLQNIAEEELGRAMDTSKAAAGVVLVLDPSTGEVVANAGRDHGVSADVAVRSAYVTGSTLKPFTLAAALEEGAVSPTDRFDCEGGAWTYHGETIHDADSHRWLTVPELLAVSSNIGFGKIYDRLGEEPLERWLHSFRFGAAPAIAGAASGWLPSRVEDRSAAGVMLAIGEKLTASPLQLAAAYAVFANGGYYVPPTLTRRAGGVPREAVVKPETARTVMTMLEGVVSRDEATGTRARVEGLRVAGKTGTAGWVLPDGRERYYASFVGLVPATSPRFVILVGLEEPDGEKAGGLVAAPVFSRVASRALAP
jgi:beta-lactamase regulating signal transducer with metallopeptidase domain